MHIAIFVGTRPEVIKMFPVVQELRQRPDCTTTLCSTGQHRELLDQALASCGLRVDIDLAVMKPKQSLTDLTANLLPAVGSVLEQLKPDMVLVQGDTTTVMAVALAAFYQRIPIGHVEAGLRSFNPDMPFPEEANRKIVAALASLHFAPTQKAMDNLRNENIPEAGIVLTGNTVVDALRLFQCSQEGKRNVSPPVADLLGRLDNFTLVTCHRRENFGAPLQNICRAIANLAEQDGLNFVFPVHLNPKVQTCVQSMLGTLPHVHLLPPLEYTDFHALLRAARLVLTDSGGVQEEGAALGKPVLVTRETTERQEGVLAGAALLLGADVSLIEQTIRKLATDDEAYTAMCNAGTALYGDGNAAQRIVDAIQEWFQKKGTVADHM